MSQADGGSSFLENLVNRVFEGSAQKLVMHLLEQGRLSDANQKEIRAMLMSRRGKRTP